MLKKPVQNSNSKMSARPELAINLLQFLIPTILYSLLRQECQFTYQPCPRGGFVRKILSFPS